MDASTNLTPDALAEWLRRVPAKYMREVEDPTVCYDQERTAERTPHLTKKCHSCQQAGSVTVLRGRVPLSEEEESGQLLELHCEGCKPVEFVFGRGWQAENPTTGTIFDIDLSAGGDFTGYDQKGGCPVEVLNACATISVVCPAEKKSQGPS
ncbi:hypothetical protein POM88_032852 [Heracleum sosnowskyi]|uniref:Uncharacterized protein n=1 Tax=Heracleum sosnowskyi TaxID=360622 RepID=A0AAD8I051_9APIA|nr:hypothetical protein POM88_032852 [Heracleum sosnowskyi]